MAWQDHQPSPRTQERSGAWARQEGEGLHLSNAQPKEEMECRERKPKDPCFLHTARVKQLPERTAE